MKYNFYLFCAFLMFFSCDFEEDLTDKNIEASKSRLDFRFSGDEWKATNGAPINARTNDELGFLVAYRVFLITENGDEEYVRSGINLDIENVSLLLEQGRHYRMEVSTTSWPSDFDHDQSLRLFNFEKGSLSELFDVEISSPDWSADHIRPFNTYLDGHREGVHHRFITWFDTDKFVGEVDFFVEGENQEIFVEMYRFSAGLNFRVENLQEGQVEFEISEFNNAFNLIVDTNDPLAIALRPLYPIYSSSTLFSDSEFDINSNTLQQYPVKAYLIDGDERRLLMHASIELKRNYNRTYILDMEPFYQDIDKIGGEITLDFVDTEWEDEYTFEF
ncbi:hypothetical protein KIH41_10030 [Litoribacter ruber]|uniref:hypothetical protein n=1 Tax=Litoribacter ruber TaxID=702568 RepID=UPI001BDAC255|nr:hypothetical protein [Litoribacter ruber]MBT0811615.1 hypothetical protein [Litoribacter ruber]